MDLYLSSPSEDLYLHLFPLPYTWQTFSEPRGTGPEWNWIGIQLPAERLPLLRSLLLLPLGDLVFIVPSAFPQLLLDASV